MDSITIERLPLLGVVKVFDTVRQETIFSGTEDVIPMRVLKQQPERIYCCDDAIIIDVKYQKVYYDTEAGWYYYESFFRSQYDAHTEEERSRMSFDEFMADTLLYEPIFEI